MNALLSFKVIMHEKPGNHNDINLKFVHLGLQNAGFPTGRLGGSLLPKILPCLPMLTDYFAPEMLGL